MWRPNYEDEGAKAHTLGFINGDKKGFRSPRSGRSSISSSNEAYSRGHRRSQSNTSTISSMSRVSFNSETLYPVADRCSTPTNFQRTLSTASTRSVAGSPAVSHEEELREVLVLAEAARNETLLCPLCRGVFRDPYIATCGHSFCRPCYSSRAEVCPLDNNQLSMVVRNLAIADQVGELLIHCRYGCKPSQEIPGGYEVDTSGCPMLIKLSVRSDHEKDCQYAPVGCPNSSKCPLLLKKDLPDHLKQCGNVRCPHLKYTCLFEGTREDMTEHLENSCKYEGLKGFLGRTEDQISDLTDELKRKDEEIMFLRSMLANLSEKVEHLEKSSEKQLELLDDRQIKLQREVVDARHGVNFVMNELQHVQVQLGVAGTMDSHHLFKCKGTFVGHAGPVWALCVSGDKLFSASSDNTIKVWDTTSFKCLNTLTGHDGIVLALCTLGEKFLYSGSVDHSVKKWDMETLEVIATIPAHENPVSSLTLNGSRLYSGSLKSINVWDIESNKLVRALPTQNHWVRALVTYEKYLYSGSYQAVKIWTLETFECVRVLQCQGGGSVYSLAVTNQHIICGTYENKINVWDVKSLESVAELTGHVGIIYSLQVIEGPTPGGTRLFSACYDKTLRVWNMEHMTCAQTLIRHDSSVTCLAIQRGRLFSGSVDSTIKVWQ
ncbi:E3 ubiquitin-protein ligase TRAF7-like [Halichondria panicea]|uniref:E3 ubiquitin-protein ligase TRAF7-like n=1 Tax=Halichondria panicea TaxID=6063 RepID=UPI00312BCA68